MRKTGLLIPAMLLLAACGAAGEKHYKVPSAAMEPTIKEGTTVTARTVKSGDYNPADEPYLSPQGQTASFPPVKVPAGEIYVMEDRRGSGNDSAQHGTLPVGTVIGVIEH